MTPERFEFLRLKGRLLYGKDCGTHGEGICAENYALYHLARGEIDIVHEFLAFLESQVLALLEADPEGRLAMTERLLQRIRAQLLE